MITITPITSETISLHYSQGPYVEIILQGSAEEKTGALNLLYNHGAIGKGEIENIIKTGHESEYWHLTGLRKHLARASVSIVSNRLVCDPITENLTELDLGEKARELAKQWLNSLKIETNRQEMA